MLGRIRRTSRIDVGLAMGFSGVACLIWFIVAGASREMVQQVIYHTARAAEPIHLPAFSRAVKNVFVDAGFVIDLIGLVWLLLSLVLVIYSSRQRLSISYAWASTITQGLVAALGGVVVGYAMVLPYRQLVSSPDGAAPVPTAFERVSELSLPVVLTVAVVMWGLCVTWMLIRYHRYKLHRISLPDGLRTNVFR
jgi:hypothetical protein